jgi:UDP-N-acetylmuramoylalanine--D-glutamate ligase
VIAVTALAGQSIALFGLGGSGLVTAKALTAGGANVTAWDDNPASVERASSEGIATGDLRKADWTAFEALVIAPGVPLTHPQPHWAVALSARHDVPIYGDVDLFFQEMARKERRAPVIAITGTNGKSTTTALIAHVLAQAGRDVQMGGNIGRAVLDLDPIAVGENARGQVYVVEVSSYQIDTAPNIAPDVGILLNITPDHLERHGTFERYAAIKERLVAAADLAVIAKDDETCRAIAGRWAGKPLVTISTHEAADIRFDDGVLIRDGETIADLRGIGTLRGAHNGQNAAAAFAACEAVGLEAAQIQAGFKSFPGLAHRMELLGHVGETLFVNDSKATNAEAAATALNSFPRVRWIAGGLAKDGGIEALVEHFPRIEKAYLIGEAAGSFASQLGDTVPYEISGTLEDAVFNAALDARREGGEQVVLLSPAAASFDQFANFEKRGEAFSAHVAALADFSAFGERKR